MMRTGMMLGVGAALSTLPAGWSQAFAAEIRTVDAQWPAVRALVERYVGARKVSGMVAVLGWGKEAPGYIRRGLEGFDDRDPDGPQSLFRAYSMTKPITGMAAMILVDEGKLMLDQPLADFAPEFAQMQVAIDPDKGLESRPAQTPITIRHLLTHTNGFGYPVVSKDKVSEELKRLGLNPGLVSRSKLPGINDGPPTPGPDEFLRLAATVPLVAEPGTKWRYSIGLDILGIVIQRASGARSFDAFVDERIFRPAGMVDSFFQVPRRFARHLTTNYALLTGVPVVLDRPNGSIFRDAPPFAFGGSGLVTSPADYDRFLAMIVNGGMAGSRRVLNEAAVRLGTSNLLPPGADTTGTYVANYGFGAGGVVGLGKDEGLYGWSGAAGTVGFAQTRLQLRTSLFVQYMPQDSLPIAREFPKAVAADLAKMGKAPV